MSRGLVGNKILYHRRANAMDVQNSVLVPATSRTVMILPRGGQNDGGDGSAVSTTNVHRGHGFTIGGGDAFMNGTTESTIRALATVSTGGVLSWSGGFSTTDGDTYVNLGNDTGVGSGSPNYDSSDVPVYTSLDSTTPETISKVTTDATTGEYEYWTTESRVWELVLTAGGAAGTIIRDVPLEPVEDIVQLFDVTAVVGATPTADIECRIYLKDGNLVVQYNDSGTTRYKYLDLIGTGATWVHTTVEPS